MKVSVVIPAYNEENYIAACLESMLDQEEKADEIIVVNNNSTDRTVDIVKQYPVRMINETEQGMIQARNRGFNEAHYEIIARTDSDTRVSSDWIKKIKQNFIDADLVALSGSASTYDAPNSFSKLAAEQTLKSYLKFMKRALGHDCLIGPNMAIRKSAWEKVKDSVCLKDHDVHEDIDLSIHLAPFGKIKNDPTLFVNSSLRRFKIEKFESYFEYPYRVIKSIRKHKKLVMEQKGKAFVKKLFNKAFPMEQIRSDE
jgi:glycosyltransferase involved in cell wall biosynthesis